MRIPDAKPASQWSNIHKIRAEIDRLDGLCASMGLGVDDLLQPLVCLIGPQSARGIRCCRMMEAGTPRTLFTAPAAADVLERARQGQQRRANG